MAGRKKDKRRRKYSSSSSSDSGSSSSSSSSSSGSSSQSSSSSQNPRQQTPNVSTPPTSQSLDPVSAMFLDTKPEELIDQIFIILDEAEIKDLCPTIIKHMSMPDLKERALSCIRSLDEEGLQSLYVTQEPDPGAEEIDKALIQLGLVGNSTSILDRDTSKWRTVQEATPPATLSDNEAGNSGEAAASGGEKDATIFEEEAKSSAPPQPDLPKRKLLEDAPPESSDDAELWRALLMKDKQKMSETLVSTNVIANNLSDKPIDFVPEETVVRRRGDESDREDESGKSSPRSPATPDVESQQEVIGNPPLAIGNPPLAESPGKPKLSYRQRAAAAAAQEEEEEDKISAGDLSSGASSSDSESSSSEEGEISDDDDEEKNEEKKDSKPESENEEKLPESPERSSVTDADVKNLDEKSDNQSDKCSPKRDSDSEQTETRTENDNNEDVSKLYAL